jgi:hypothetical protein
MIVPLGRPEQTGISVSERFDYVKSAAGISLAILLSLAVSVFAVKGKVK